MKKILVLLIIVAVAVPVFSNNNSGFNPRNSNSNFQQNTSINFNIGNLGFGGNLPFSNDYDFEFNFSLISVGFENINSSMGIEFSPLMFYGWLNTNEYDYGYEDEYGFWGASLVNVRFYWNLINMYSNSGSNFYIGPFAAANYIFMDEDIRFDKFIFTAGIHMGMRTTFGSFNYNIFSFEVGYRNINGTSKYFIGGKIDLLTLFLASVIFH